MESGSTVVARSTRSSVVLAGAAKPAEAKRGRARRNLVKSMARGGRVQACERVDTVLASSCRLS
jgi:hypothetical protein